MTLLTIHRGFSLVEVLVAITILLLVMVGPMRVLTQATNSTAFSTEQTTAFFMAQEGLEMVQMQRDNLVLNEFAAFLAIPPQSTTNPMTTFQTGVLQPCFSPNGCGLHPTNASPFVNVTTCTAGACQLFENSNALDRARYTHTQTGNTRTGFTRTIRIGTMPGSPVQGFIATSTVTWRTGSLAQTQTVELVTVLANVYGM